MNHFASEDSLTGTDDRTGEPVLRRDRRSMLKGGLALSIMMLWQSDSLGSGEENG